LEVLVKVWKGPKGRKERRIEIQVIPNLDGFLRDKIHLLALNLHMKVLFITSI
jgi:hypothetical protein